MTIEKTCGRIKNTTTEKLLAYTGKYWQVESFHWLLYMNYNEDDSKVSNVNSQKCLNVIRKYCISIIKSIQRIIMYREKRYS